MKKFLFYALQIISLFLFVVLLSGVYNTFKDVVNNKESLGYNIGYCFGAVLVLGLFFWLNIRLYKYANRGTAQKENNDIDSLSKKK